MTKILLRRIHALVLATCIALVLPSALHAQGTGLVLPGDFVYADIERLSELGVLDSIIIGQRPYSRREIARIARVARARLEGRSGTAKQFSADVEYLANGLLAHLDRFSDDGEPSGTGGCIIAGRRC